MTTRIGVAAAIAMVLSAAVGQAADRAAAKIEFKRTQLDNVFRSEGVAAGDFNRDGKLDIAAGTVYYQAPDWKMVPIGDKPPEYDGATGYSNSFCNFTDDLNRDGWDDLIVVDFPGIQTWWFENPQGKEGPWKKHTCVPETNNESPTYLDLDGDGKRELIFSTQDRMAFAKPQADFTAPWQITTISEAKPDWTHRFYHGLGVGDINGDGRNDVVIPNGWWEAPEDRTQKEWTFHEGNLGPACAQMHVHDFDGDGDSDVVSSSAHQTGVWWYEQDGGEWKQHEIDTTFSQTHAMCFADMNGDGKMDFVTGKRWWAHGPAGDPGSEQPAVLFWYEFSREGGSPQWTPHEIDHDSGMGTQFEVVDLNKDGLLDVISANKKGAHYFEQVRP